jgi:hypothetical protein
LNRDSEKGKGGRICKYLWMKPYLIDIKQLGNNRIMFHVEHRSIRNRCRKTTVTFPDSGPSVTLYLGKCVPI